MSESLRVTIKDFRAAGICPAARHKFFEPHGLDWKDFVRNGIDADLLIATGDPRALPVVEVARGRR